MPIGAFKLNSISKYLASAPAGRTAKTINNAGVAQSLLGGSGSFTNATVSTSVKKYGTGSISLNGTNQFIWLPSSYNSDFSFTGDFTLEAWVYQTTTTGFRAIITNWESGIFWGINGGTALAVYLNGSLIVNATGLTFTANTWYHVAVSRSGSSVKLWKDGTQVGSTGTNSATINCTDFTGIGCNVNNYPTNNIGSYFSGYIDDVRISNSARYTSNFTAPTAALVNDANTLLLVHADGTNGSTVFLDDNGSSSRSQNAISASGNAQVSTAQSKFGGSSALFDGTGDYLNIDNSSGNFTYGTNNFTVELWFRTSSIATSVLIWDQRSTATQNNLCIYFNSDGARVMTLVNGTNVITSTAISANTWYHLVYSRSGNDHKMFLNGTQAGSTWTNSVSFGSTNPRLGAASTDGSAGFNGYIDEVRVSNSARYTSNFTAPTSAFVNDANTLLLVHADGTNGSTTFTDDNA